MSALRYGPEVAVPRLVDIYREFGMRQTFFLPAWCIERYPAAVACILEGGHEIGHHHYLHEHANEMPEAEERYWFERSLDVIVKATGRRPAGYRAATYQFSRNTLDILVDAGLHYDASLFGDDIPYLLENDRGSVIELPSHYGLDDWPHFQFSREFLMMMPIKSAREAHEVFREEFDAAWEYGGLWISVWHPFLSGRLARAREIRNLIRHMHEKGDVWFATLEEIAAHVRHPRRERNMDPPEGSPALLRRSCPGTRGRRPGRCATLMRRWVCTVRASRVDGRVSQTRKCHTFFCARFGVASRIRTDHLLDHNQAL